MLQEVAHRIILTVRGIDKVIRYGGDEFCVILPETDVEGANRVAERIRANVAQSTFLVQEGLKIPMTVSIGIATARSTPPPPKAWCGKPTRRCSRASRHPRTSSRWPVEGGPPAITLGLGYHA